ncbi:MAG: rane protein [Massilia sp.]|nr:rane protein [Massilia sp.]
MQIVSCPGCGAQVEFKSHASVVAVCEYCRATVMKDAESVKDLGKMSSVLEDFTRIQIGSAGVLAGRSFTVVGRIQLKYDAGMWNEWFLLFDDAGSGWLGDSSGLYTATTEIAASTAVPAFDDITVGRRYEINEGRFTAAEKRTAVCIGGQGELPFKVGDGWQARVADFRDGAAFITLDYSDGDTPVLYKGVAVTLEQMQCQLLRDDDVIKAAAGKYRGRLEALDCPSCGSAISYLPGVTTSLVCPSCQALLDAATPQAQILAKSAEVERVRTTLPLGAAAKINNAEYRLIGAMTRADDEGSTWTEYLLYNTAAGFFWLVETDEGWSRSTVMPVWPAWSSPDIHRVDRAELDKVGYNKLYGYPATVRWAAGAFNWRVAAGDVVQVAEFASGQTKLAAEWNAHELTWSRSTPLAFDQLRAWFGNALKSDPLHAIPAQKLPSTSTATRFAMWILGLNAIPLLFNFSGTIFWVVLAIVAIYMSDSFFGPKNP